MQSALADALTTLNLLTRDGAVYMAFSPSLKPAQYAELIALSEDCQDAGELRLQVSAWAARQGLSYSLDPTKEPN
jgi:hypothetical protein